MIDSFRENVDTLGGHGQKNMETVVNEVEYYVRMHRISRGHKTHLPFPKSRPPEIEHIHLDTHTLHEARDKLQELQEAKMRLPAEEKPWECRRTGGRGH